MVIEKSSIEKHAIEHPEIKQRRKVVLETRLELSRDILVALIRARTHMEMQVDQLGLAELAVKQAEILMMANGMILE